MLTERNWREVKSIQVEPEIKIMSCLDFVRQNMTLIGLSKYEDFLNWLLNPVI